MKNRVNRRARINPFRQIYDSKSYINLEVRDFPYIVDIEPTNNCNLECVFCARKLMDRELGYMSWEMLKKITDECAEYGTPMRVVRFGESFLHDRIIDYCRYIKGRGLLLHISTNGLVMSDDDMADLIDMKLDCIIFSFQGATKKRYEVMRRNNLYDELERRIRKFVFLRGDNDLPFVQITSTMTNDTTAEIDAFVDYWSGVVDFVGIGRTNLSHINPKIKGSGYRPCTEVFQKLSVDWDGKVSACCGDFNNYLVVGDMESTLYDIWQNSEELKAIRKMLENNMHRSLRLCCHCYRAYEGF